MIYITGDTHGDFERFTKYQRQKLPFDLTESDYVIICGDFGLLWEKNGTFQYNLKWLSGLPFQILWVQGNHENYDMIAEYQMEKWKGGKARHIVRDKIILLERGQIFNIEGKIFFTFGGASSHDIQGGVLDRDSSAYHTDRKKAKKSGLCYRIKHVSWWEQELPSEYEMLEGLRNLELANYQVDYVITHCASNYIEHKLEELHSSLDSCRRFYEQNVLTDYFERLEDRLQYKHWFCGHYHKNLRIDEKHTILYEKMIPLSEI